MEERKQQLNQEEVEEQMQVEAETMQTEEETKVEEVIEELEETEKEVEEVKHPKLVEELEGKYFSELDKRHQKKLQNVVLQLGVIQAKKRKRGFLLEKHTQNIPALQLKIMFEEGDLRLPAFQRGRVWDDKKKSELIYSLLTLGTIPEILVYEDKKGIKYLIDGFQRTSTIVDFMNDRFKLKFDKNIEHLEENASEKELLKALFERVNYKSTPLSKFRVVLLTLFTLGGKTEKEKEEIEKKTNLIQKYAEMIKQEDRQEKNLGFVLRVLTAYNVYKLLREVGEEIPTPKSISDMMIEVLKPYIEKVSLDELEEKLRKAYDLVCILTFDRKKGEPKPHKILSKGMRGAEIIGLMLYEMDSKGIDFKDIDDVDWETVIEYKEILENEIEEILANTGRKNATLTKDTKIYLHTLKELLKEAEMKLDWGMIIATPHTKLPEVEKEEIPQEVKEEIEEVIKEEAKEGEEVKEEELKEEDFKDLEDLA
jgi:hypothetical protein